MSLLGLRRLLVVKGGQLEAGNENQLRVQSMREEVMNCQSVNEIIPDNVLEPSFLLLPIFPLC